MLKTFKDITYKTSIQGYNYAKIVFTSDDFDNCDFTI